MDNGRAIMEISGGTWGDGYGRRKPKRECFSVLLQFPEVFKEKYGERAQEEQEAHIRAWLKAVLETIDENGEKISLKSQKSVLE